MKTKIFFKPIATLLFAAGALCFVACSDEWDKHYGNEDSQSASDQPSLYELIKADESLQEFVKVLDHTGYDLVLKGAQALTVLAPSITSEQADSVIALYDAQKRELVTMPDGSVRYIQDKDNKAITQFVQNHIALYGRTVSENYSDTIRMMNGKYLHLTNESLSGVPFQRRNVVARNGILYTLQGKENFQPSVRELLELSEGLDSVAAFYKLFDEYSLDENASVQRGIINGRIIYADSVLKLSNRLYGDFGWLNREDSAYLFMAPTNEVWTAELERFRPMFKYVEEVENRDSVADLNARISIIRGRMFNLNDQRGKKIEEVDTLKNTLYVLDKDHYGLNVFEKNTLFDGLTPWTCSNGTLYKDNDNRVDSKLTFLEARYLMASNPAGFKVGKMAYGGNVVNQVSASVKSFTEKNYDYSYKEKDGTVITKTFKVDSLKSVHLLQGDNFLEVTPLAPGTSTNKEGRIYFYLPSTLAGVYYNVYVVMVPAFLGQDEVRPSDILPTRFQAYFHEREEKIRTDRIDSALLQKNPNEDAKYETESNDKKRLLNVPDVGNNSLYKDGSNNFKTTGNDVDIICIDLARKCKFSSYNWFDIQSEPVMRYYLNTAVRTTQLGSTMTNVMRINRIIYIPFETEEEAKAFNIHEYLNANKLSNLKEYNIAR